MDTYIKTFDQLNKQSVPSAGGKGASLGEMTQAGIPVPPGFVVLSGAFEQFLKETDLSVEIDSKLHKVDHNAIHTVEEASEKIRALILQAEIPQDIKNQIREEFKKLDAEFVAVRSSATAEDSASAAWAGQLDSFLNTTEETLLENVKKCWASLFTPRAIFYRFEQNLHKQKISVAVVVQKMVNSEKSGIAFSVHPVTQDYNQLIIEAGYGLGEAIVSGQITPDGYVVEKDPRNILDKNINTQTKKLIRAKNGGNQWQDIQEDEGQVSVLTDKQILELTDIILKIENHYGTPQDIEWAYEACPNTEGGRDGKFFITQSRPITTLANNDDDNTNFHADQFLDQFSSENSSVEHADGKPVYFEMTMAGFTDRLPGSNLDAYSVGISHFYDEQLDYISLIENQDKIGSTIVDDYITNSSNIKDLYTRWVEKFNGMLKDFQRVYDLDLSDKSKEDVLHLSDEIYEYYRHKVSMPGFLDGFMFYAEKRLVKLVDDFCKKNGIGDSASILTTLIATTEPSFFNERDVEILKVSNEAEREDFIRKYAWINSGYFGYREYTLDDFNIDLQHARDVDARATNTELTKNKQNKQELIRKYEFSEEIVAIVELSDLFIKWQDQRKVYSLTYATLRHKILREVSLRFGIDFSILEYALTSELNRVLRGDISIKELQNRINNHLLFVHVGGVCQNILVGDAARIFFDGLRANDNIGDIAELEGFSASRGIAKGKVKVIMSARDIENVEMGEILVAPMTRPEHLLGMKKAAAIVTDDGGITCHAAIVSRELGKPCIIGTKIATQVLKDGDLVEVDADNGVVRVLERGRGLKDN